MTEQNLKSYNGNFINLTLNDSNFFVYTVRTALQKALDKSLGDFYGVLLDIGCGEMPYRDYILDKNPKITKYIGVDIDYNEHHQSVKPDLYWDGKKIPIENESVDTVIATEFFEHVSNISEVLVEINRVLKKDGLLYFTVPFLWPLHETPFDEFRYTPYSLERFLKSAGFKNIKITPLGVYNSALAQMIGIWIYNYRVVRGMDWKMKIFIFFQKTFIHPFMKYLIKRDEKLNSEIYSENTMPTGFYVYAKK